MKGLFECQLGTVGIALLLHVIIFFLFICLTSLFLSSSQQLLTPIQADLENPKKPYYYQIYSANIVNNDPFRFPMPLGEIDPNRQISTHHNSEPNHDTTPSLYTNKQQKHSTFKAIIVPDNKTMVNMKHTASKEATHVWKQFNGVSNNMYVYNNNSSSRSRSDTDNTSKIYGFYANGKIVWTRYQITGLSNKLLNMTMKNDNSTLLIDVSAASSGFLIIELPANIIINSSAQDAKTEDITYTVFEDGLYRPLYQSEKNNSARQIIIAFDKGTSQIAIVATHASSEYGIAITGIYAISATMIITILLVLAKYTGSSLVPLNRS